MTSKRSSAGSTPYGLLSLPTEILNSILSMVGTVDLLQNVQLTCMPLRQILKHPAPGTYGRLTVHAECRDSDLHLLDGFRQLSKFLSERAAGIDLLIVSEDPESLETDGSTCELLFRWLLGRHDNIMLGMQTNMLLRKYAKNHWGTFVDNVSSRLLVLELNHTSSIWSLLFHCKALKHLRLSVKQEPVSTDSENEVETEIPVDRKFLYLETLQLENCTASVSPLLVGTLLPKLRSLKITLCNGNVDIDWTTFAKLEEFHVKSSCLNLLEGFPSAPVPAPALRKLTVVDSEYTRVEDLLQGASQLSDLTTNNWDVDVVSEMIESLPALTLYTFYPDGDEVQNFYQLGRIEKATAALGGFVKLASPVIE